MKNALGEEFCATVDFNKNIGGFNRRLHSSNSAPNLCDRGIKDFTPDYKRMNFTMSRTHDWALWNQGQRMVDTHFVFPLMHLDPKDERNYYFAPTDEMIRICQDAGSKVFYRLGTSIEHSGLRPDQLHFNSLPPEDYEKYAEVLAGIVRHYTRGWANGFHYDMQYWEIWNEAENDPTCWKGPYEEFIKFFVVVLKRLKQEFPELKFGGPAATWANEEMLGSVLKACKDAGLAPDFLSWHHYGCDAKAFIAEAGKMRKLLDSLGFTKCETAITEWHYLVTWVGVQNNLSEDAYNQVIYGPTGLCGVDAAVFNIAALCGFQDNGLDMAFYYGASPKGNWGYYKPSGAYNKNFHSMCLFGKFLGSVEQRAEASGLENTIYTLAGLSGDGRSGRLIVADYKGQQRNLFVKVEGMENARVTAQLLDGQADMEFVPVDFHNGTLRLTKTGSGSAVFLVNFECQ